ncbi:uncharacterized protein LOC124927548 [Impatiens glandulifera]|uniref:uncharacterized protein LOC124927548 n=1 Tax=Impatiens glandulifera TaxID=253017 RepID=UPI001FB0C8B6|nr:uncharacterized protein LOC124927548 [Impatiens glandulifera]
MMEEALKESDGNFMVYIHPSKANQISKAILRQFSSLLFQFNQTFDGVLLSYDVIETDNQVAKILPGIHPYFCVNLRTKLLLFHPKPNMLLEGKVLKLSQQSIHVVVLGFLSAVITEEDISKDFRYRIKHDKEFFAKKSDKRHRIEVGTFVRFSVKSFDKEMLHISGSLASEETGNLCRLNTNSKEHSHSNRKTKKRKECEGQLEIPEKENDTDHRNKKSKR